MLCLGSVFLFDRRELLLLFCLSHFWRTKHDGTSAKKDRGFVGLGLGVFRIFERCLLGAVNWPLNVSIFGSKD